MIFKNLTNEDKSYIISNQILGQKQQYFNYEVDNSQKYTFRASPNLPNT